MIERVGFVATDNTTIQPMNCHIHQTELGIVLHLFLSVKGHLGIGIYATFIHKVACLYEHATRTTSRIEQDALLWLQYINEHLDQGLWSEEHAIV